MTATFMNPISFNLEIHSLSSLLESEVASTLVPTHAKQRIPNAVRKDAVASSVETMCDRLFATYTKQSKSQAYG